MTATFDKFLRLPVWIVLAAVTLIYLLVEFSYNHALLALVGNAEATHETIEQLSNRGKVLAAFGLAWSFGFPLIMRFFQSLFLRLGVFAALWLGLFLAIGHVYDRVLAGISQPVIEKSLSLLTYRVEVASGRIADPLMQHHAEVDQLALMAIPVLVFDERTQGYMNYASRLVSKKVDDLVAEQGGDAATLKASGEKIKTGYRTIMNTVLRLHKEFVDNSLRAAGSSIGEAVFKRRSGGLEPNPFATREQFFSDILPKSTLPEAVRLMGELNEPRAKLPDGSTFKMIDIPPFQTDTEVAALVDERIGKLVALAIEKQRKEFMEGPQSRTYAAAVLVPPISMTLSLFTILTSLGTLVHILARRFAPKIARIPMLAFQAAPLAFMLLIAPASGFSPDGGMVKMEQKMVDEMGLTGKVWRQANALQAQLMALTGQRPH